MNASGSIRLTEMKTSTEESSCVPRSLDKILTAMFSYFITCTGNHLPVTWHNQHIWIAYPANIYLFKVSTRNTRKRCEMCQNLTMKTPELRH